MSTQPSHFSRPKASNRSFFRKWSHFRGRISDHRIQRKHSPLSPGFQSVVNPNGSSCELTQTDHRNNLTESGQFLDGVLQSLSEGIIVLDENGILLRVNEAFCQMSGEKESDLLDTKPPFWLELKKRLMARGPNDDSGAANHDMEFKFMLPKGKQKEIPTQVRLTVLRNCRTQSTIYLLTFNDVSQIAQAEEVLRTINVDLEKRVQLRTTELENAIKELEAFSYSVSHDLRSPLRSIRGFSSMLLDQYRSDLPHEAVHFLDRIQWNVTHMSQLIEDLLDFSRINRYRLNKKVLDIDLLIGQVSTQIVDEYPEREVEINTAKMPECVADRSLLAQVFLNLFSNSIKYSDQKEKLRIDISSSSTNGSTVYSVADNGIGFDMRDREKIFGVFQRLHSSDHMQGTGVGLALVRRIIRRHGGEIWASSELGKGAIFSFSLESQD